jgi:hypothetical protein
MKRGSIKSFVADYLYSLHERTRKEKTGTKWGLDWVVYNLGFARFGKPVRLPFMRGGGQDYGKSKVEAEFGIDLAFLSEDRQDLVIFVLKDEPLTNKNWTNNDFDRDLRMAMAPDLNTQELDKVTSVTVILAYNKDDEQNGIALYNRLTSSAPSTLRGNILLAFVRWNLSELVEQTVNNILNPSLVPERFFGQLSYLAAQAGDFTHGSDAWEQQLLPNWKRFLNDILAENDRGASLVSVALIILNQHAQTNVSFSTGWIDLIEWAALALWDKYAKQPDGSILGDVQHFWNDFYIVELESFYRSNIAALGTEHSVDLVGGGSFIGPLVAACVAFWHVARLGLLSLQVTANSQAQGSRESVADAKRQEFANWMIMLLNANVSARRPLLDIQHIEIFLIVECFRAAGRLADIGEFIVDLQSRLFLRRFGRNDLPFLDSANSLRNVFEQVATKPADSLISTQSSFFVLVLLELCCLIPGDSREQLIAAIHRRLVLGAADVGDPGEFKSLDLMSWIPPADWAQRIFAGPLQEGEAVVVHRFSDNRDAGAPEILAGMRRIVTEMRKAQTFELPEVIPLSALVLACLRYGSPLPPEIWRRHAFPVVGPSVTQ